MPDRFGKNVVVYYMFVDRVQDKDLSRVPTTTSILNPERAINTILIAIGTLK